MTRSRRPTTAGNPRGPPRRSPAAPRSPRAGTGRRARTRNRSPLGPCTASSRLDALFRIDSASPVSARGENRRLTSPRNAAVLGRIHVEDRPGQHRRPAGADGVVDQRTPSRAEAERVSAEIPDVLVAGDRPETRSAPVHRILGPQPCQDLVVVLPQEERCVPRVDALVPGHGPSVLCSAMRTRVRQPLLRRPVAARRDDRAGHRGLPPHGPADRLDAVRNRAGPGSCRRPGPTGLRPVALAAPAPRRTGRGVARVLGVKSIDGAP